MKVPVRKSRTEDAEGARNAKESYILITSRKLFLSPKVWALQSL